MRLCRLAVALPDQTVRSDEIAAWTGAAPEFIVNKIGVENRHYLRADETAADLARAACQRLFDQQPGLGPRDVELLVLVTQNPDYRLPHTAAILQSSLGLPRSCASFDLNLGCSGYVYGLTAVAGFMAAQGMQNALLVTCDPYSKVMRREDKNTVTIFGDAATATWMSSQQGARLGRGDFGTDGAGAKSLMIRAGGSARPLGGLYGGDNGYAPEDVAVAMNGRAIYNFMMRRAPLTVAACLQKNGLTNDEVDLFVFHQASKFLLESLRARMDLPEEKTPISLSQVGNTVSSTIPIVLEELFAADRLAGKTVVVCGFGVGLSWGTNVLYF
jgi:3-oxoacyl-[acyl-carrier-protein] synthase-3